MTVENRIELQAPLSRTELSATASFEARGPERKEYAVLGVWTADVALCDVLPLLLGCLQSLALMCAATPLRRPTCRA